MLLVLPYKIRSNVSGISGLRRGQVLQGLCSTRSVREVMRLLTFAFGITKYSHTEELQHPDGMMNALNQPQDVTVSTQSSWCVFGLGLGLCVWEFELCCEQDTFLCHLSLGNIPLLKKKIDLLITPFSNLMKLRNCSGSPPEVTSWLLAAVLGCPFILPR